MLGLLDQEESLNYFSTMHKKRSKRFLFVSETAFVDSDSFTEDFIDIKG